MSRVNPVKFGESERLDSHHRAIIDFIKNRPHCTENQVVKAMEEQKVCSKMTTLRKLDELIEKQEITDLLKEGKSGFHRFIINEHNEFNKIYASLFEIESVIDKIDSSAGNNIRKASRSGITMDTSKMHTSTSEYQEFMDVIWFNVNFKSSYEHGLDQMLHRLMSRTSTKIQSEKDSQILYNKIVHLLRKLYSQFPSGRPLKDILNEITDVRLTKAKSSPLVEKFDIDTNLIDGVKQVMENFKTQFLIDAKPKATRTS